MLLRRSTDFGLLTEPMLNSPPAGRWSQLTGTQVFHSSEPGCLSSELQKLPGLLHVQIEPAVGQLGEPDRCQAGAITRGAELPYRKPIGRLLQEQTSAD